MNRKTLYTLIAVNMALLAGLIFSSFSSTAVAQRGGGLRAGEYLMVAAKVIGKESKVLYITDIANQAMLTVSFTTGGRGTGQLTADAVRDIAEDFEARPTGRR